MSALHGLLLVVALWMFSGCAGYRLGPANGREAGAQSIQVRPFLNHSPAPGLADELTSALRRSIQQDGTLRLETQGDADLLLEGVITQFQRREISLLSEDVRTVRDYEIKLVARVTVRERASGKVVLDRDVAVGSVLRVGADLSASERQAAPVLANDIARKITTLLVDGGW